jgi:hypothetical protein
MFIGKIKSGTRKLFLSYHMKVLQIAARNMRAILNTIEAAYQAVRSTGSKRILSTICIAERLDASRTLEDDVESVNEMLPKSTLAKGIEKTLVDIHSLTLDPILVQRSRRIESFLSNDEN